MKITLGYISNDYQKVGLLVTGIHLVCLVWILVWGMIHFVAPVQVVMMAEVIDREANSITAPKSVAKIQEQAKPEKIKEPMMTLSERSSERVETSAKNSQGQLSSASVYLPDAYAKELNNPKPPYPAISRRLGEQGRVQLKLCVSAHGELDLIQLEQSSGYSRLDQIAIETVGRWKFMPAKQGVQAIAMCYQLPIQFTLEK